MACFKQPERVARHADEPRLAFLLQLVQDVRGLVEDVLVVGRELDVVGEQDLDVIGAEPLAATPRSTCRIPSGVKSNTARSSRPAFVQMWTFSRQPPCRTSPRISSDCALAVVRGRVDEVDAGVDGGVDAVRRPRRPTPGRTAARSPRRPATGRRRTGRSCRAGGIAWTPDPQMTRSQITVIAVCASAYSFTPSPRIDSSAASIIFCAVIASSSVLSGFCAHPQAVDQEVPHLVGDRPLIRGVRLAVDEARLDLDVVAVAVRACCRRCRSP